jgi:thiamine biosynthesis lipoprotein
MADMRKVGGWLAVVLTLFFGLLGCGQNEQTHHARDEVFGTVVDISIYGESEARAGVLSARVLDEFRRLHNKFHAWQPSALTALNDSIARGIPYQADAEMVTLLQAAQELANNSDDTFNPAIGRLIRLWGFQSGDITPQRPPAAEVKRLVDANPRMADLQFDGTTITSRNSMVMVDLGGFAKGYALDRAAQILRSEHVDAALINIGGNILAIGSPGARPWQIGLQDPRSDGMVASVFLRDNEAIGTSGDYQRYFITDGKRRPHIINPKSGEPIDLVASVTIVTSGGSDAGTRSDGNTKPLFIVGPQGWKAMAKRLNLREVMLIDASGNIEITPAMKARMIGKNTDQQVP